jgi:hypothetical protein
MKKKDKNQGLGMDSRSPLNRDLIADDAFSGSVKNSCATMTQKNIKGRQLYDFEKETSLIKIVKRTSDNSVPKYK